MFSSLGSRGRRTLGAIAALLAAAAGIPIIQASPVAADTMPKDPSEPVTLSADSLPTVQVNGVVWDTEIVGDRVFATGEFTHARPSGAAPGTNQTARANILAFNLHTGALITTWNPSLNAQGMALESSPDGSVLYVGGDFTQVNGVNRSRIAALNTQTGALVAGFNASSNARVQALEHDGTRLYLGGDFSIVGGQARSRLAAVNPANGAPVAGWAPVVDDTIWSMTLPEGSGRLVIAGYFRNVNETQQRGSASLDLTTGQVQPWAVNELIKVHGPGGAITSVSSDGDRVYGTGSVWNVSASGGAFEGVFAADPMTGEVEWINGCRGDSYDTSAIGDVVYVVNHAHHCDMVGGMPQLYPHRYQRAQAMTAYPSPDGAYLEFGSGPSYNFSGFPGRPRPQLLHWEPYLPPGTYTGQGQGPWNSETNGDYLILGGEFPQVNGGHQQGLARFATREIAPNNTPVQGFPDLQPVLTPLGPGTVRVGWTAAYDFDNKHLTVEVLRGSTVLETRETAVAWWGRPALGFVDSTAPPGTTQTYRIRVNDAYGNGFTGPPSSILVPGGTKQPEPYRDSVLEDAPHRYWRLDGQPGSATSLDWGESNDLALDASVTLGAEGALLNSPNAAAAFGGDDNPISATVPASATDRELGPQTFSVEAWVKTTSTTGGKVVGFGYWNDQRNNRDHVDRHIYMTDDGQFRFGVRPDMKERVTITSGPGFNDGEWHHVVASLSPAGMKLHVDGNLVGANPNVTKAQVYWGYWRVGGDRLLGDNWIQNWPVSPTHEAIEAEIDEVAVYDHELPTNRVQAHYRASGRAGDFPNLTPTPVITADVNGSTVSVDGSSSKDDDGTVETYEWDFGDGSTATGPTAQHTYGAAGAYLVTLTVTDNEGGEASAYRGVAIAHAQDFARDEFTRTSINSWGNADVGGAWSVAGAVADFSVNGGQGRILGGAGLNRGAYLQGVTSLDTDLRFDVTMDRDAAVDGAYVSAFARRSSNGADSYSVKMRYFTNGTVQPILVRRVNNVETNLAVVNLPGLATAGEALSVRLQVTGVSSTVLRAKVWRVGQPEPSTWTVSNTSATPPALQSAGHLGVNVYLSGSWTGARPVLTFDNLRAGADLDATGGGGPNLAPLAHFTSATSFLTASFDASTSMDADGDVISHEWDFGDGQSASGPTASHSFDEAGDYTVTLTVMDDDGATNEYSATVTVTEPPPPPPNVPPTAVLSWQARSLYISTSASGSMDVDGSIVSYEWDFGDGHSATGSYSDHTYAEGGTYTVTLTVTDNRGDSTTVHEEIQVSVLAFDDFERTEAAGWGDALHGGSWSHVGPEEDFSVSLGHGWIWGSPTEARSSYLSEVSERDVEILAEVQYRTEVALPVGGNGSTASFIVRSDENGNDYRLKLWWRPDNTLWAYIVRTENGVETVLAENEVPGLVLGSTDLLHVRFWARGTDEVSLFGKAWGDDTAEPLAPIIEFKDENPPEVLKQAGSVGVSYEMSDTWTETWSLFGVESFDVAKATK